MDLPEQTCCSATECQSRTKGRALERHCQKTKLPWKAGDVGDGLWQFPCQSESMIRKRPWVGMVTVRIGAAEWGQKGTIGGCRGRISCLALWLGFPWARLQGEGPQVQGCLRPLRAVGAGSDASWPSMDWGPLAAARPKAAAAAWASWLAAAAAAACGSAGAAGASDGISAP